MAPELFDVEEQFEKLPKPTTASDVYALSMVAIEVRISASAFYTILSLGYSGFQWANPVPSISRRDGHA